MTLSYLDQPLERFLDLVASREPAPGGGATAAVTTALAAGLVVMAARFSEAHLPQSAALAEQADRLRRRVEPCVDEDARAYRAVLDAYGLPKEPDPEGRRERIRLALHAAAEVPLRIAEAGAQVAGLGACLAAEGGDPDLRGDAVTAALLAEAAVRSAVCLVRINVELGGLGGDLLDRADRCVEEATEAARRAAASRA